MCESVIFPHLIILACYITSLLDCEPEEVDDWSPAASNFHCSFCSLPLEKLSVSPSHRRQPRMFFTLCIKYYGMFMKYKYPLIPLIKKRFSSMAIASLMPINKKNKKS